MRHAAAMADLLYPPRCVLCAQYVKESDRAILTTFYRPRLCSTCAGGLSDLRAVPACPGCGASAGRMEVSRDRCAECRDVRSVIRGTVRVGPYRAGLATLVRNFKFNGREDCGTLLHDWLRDAVVRAPWLDRVQVVVPVPGHWTGRLRGRVHLADALARTAARVIHRPCHPLLRRRRVGRRQVGLSYTERLKNVRGAFVLRGGVELQNARLLLVDDVRTTGATLAECARVLGRAGASEVYAAVIGRADWQPGSKEYLDVS